MKIGICMPSFNQASFLPAAIKSVLEQKHQDFHMVIINDGSTDNTQSILNKADGDSQITIVQHEKNHGTAAAINTGKDTLDRIHYPYDALTWVSSDNIMYSHWLSTLVAVMEKHGAGAVYGGFDYVAPRFSKHMFQPYFKDALISKEECYFGPAFLIRKDVWHPHEGKISHDYANWLRVEEACWEKGLPIVGHNESLCRYNAHDQRVTITRRNEYDAPQHMKIAIERRKKGIKV